MQMTRLFGSCGSQGKGKALGRAQHFADRQTSCQEQRLTAGPSPCVPPRLRHSHLLNHGASIVHLWPIVAIAWWLFPRCSPLCCRGCAAYFPCARLSTTERYTHIQRRGCCRLTTLRTRTRKRNKVVSIQRRCA